MSSEKNLPNVTTGPEPFLSGEVEGEMKRMWAAHEEVAFSDENRDTFFDAPKEVQNIKEKLIGPGGSCLICHLDGDVHSEDDWKDCGKTYEEALVASTLTSGEDGSEC